MDRRPIQNRHDAAFDLLAIDRDRPYPVADVLGILDLDLVHGAAELTAHPEPFPGCRDAGIDA